MEPYPGLFMNLIDLMLGIRSYLSKSYRDFEDQADYVQHGRNGIEVIIPKVNLFFDNLNSVRLLDFDMDNYEQKVDDEVWKREMYFSLLSRMPTIFGKIRENSSLGGVEEYEIFVCPSILKKFPLRIEFLEDGFIGPSSISSISLEGRAIFEYKRDNLLPVMSYFEPYKRPEKSSLEDSVAFGSELKPVKIT